MAGDQVSAEQVGQPQCPFEIDPAAALKCAESGHVEGFRRDVCGKTAVAETGHRQTDAVDRDAFTLLQFPHGQTGGHRQAALRSAALQ